MIIGIINARGEPVVTIPVKAPAGAFMSVSFVVDTGFSDYLALPSDLIETLQLSPRDTALVQMADGRVVLVTEYDGGILWDGIERIVTVQGGEGDPLLGLALLEGYNLSVDVTASGAVRITPLVAPPPALDINEEPENEP